MEEGLRIDVFVVVQYGIHRDQSDYILEHQVEFPGVRLTDSYLRKYRYQSLAAHVLGYVGPVSKEEYKQLRTLGYQPTDAIGQAASACSSFSAPRPTHGWAGVASRWASSANSSEAFSTGRRMATTGIP